MSCGCAGMQQCELCCSVDATKHPEEAKRLAELRRAALPGDNATTARLRAELASRDRALRLEQQYRPDPAEEQYHTGREAGFRAGLRAGEANARLALEALARRCGELQAERDAFAAKALELFDDVGQGDWYSPDAERRLRAFLEGLGGG